MRFAPDDSDQFERAALPDDGAGERPPTGGPTFSALGTVLALLFVLTALTLFTGLRMAVPVLDRVADADQSLERIVGRMLALDDAIEVVSDWERAFYELTLGGKAEDLNEAIRWYEELAESTAAPLPHLYATVLQAEDGGMRRIEPTLVTWTEEDEPFATYAALLRAAYGTSGVSTEAGQVLQAELAEVVPDGWFYTTLALAVAERSGDRETALRLGEARIAQGRPLLWRLRALVGAQVAVILAGSLAALRLGWGHARAGARKVGSARLPPPWRGWTGVAVMARGGALGMAWLVLLVGLGIEDPVLRILSVPLAVVPLLVLGRRWLLEPAGLAMRDAFGLAVERERRATLLFAIGALTALGLLGEVALGVVADWAGWTSHWTEWYDEDLVSGDLAVAGTALAVYVVIAPVTEELVFRGLLFATLRRRLNIGAAALVSAAIFALLHGYGLAGLLSVLYSGVLWAVAYEVTGSLLVGMVAHMVNNLIVTASILLFVRF